jgi:prepilin-type N-terminal cleavage/methylation domain-containing protein
MLSTKKYNKGFTIIEVLIVLAIAGLIMVIVFLAVPALQRNSRNTQYRSEANQLLAAATEWSNNNGGKAPNTTDTGAPILALTKNKNITTLTVVAALASGQTNVDPSTAPSLTTAVLVPSAKCGTTIGKISSGSARQIALVFAIEDSSGNATNQCQDS